jgi:hypothetical protein
MAGSSPARTGTFTVGQDRGVRLWARPGRSPGLAGETAACHNGGAERQAVSGVLDYAVGDQRIDPRRGQANGLQNGTRVLPQIGRR